MKRLVAKISCWSAGWIIYLNGLSSKCFAEANPGTTGSVNSGAPDLYPGVSSFDTFKMIVQVIFFLIVIIGLFFLIIKFLSQKNKFFGFGRSFRSLGGVPLGTNKSIQVIELGKSLYVVGVGDNIQLLEKIDDQDEVEFIKEMLSSPANTGQSLDVFATWLNKWRGRKQEEDLEEVNSSFQQVFMSKMQNVTNRKKMVEQLMDEQKADRLNDK
ncbi:flagellar biosynthetic protein FliO [Paenibacillus hamazuiensis]|uniref:flagellar biosynthetic protein FliO n=1 Tax=Paenibacillus hamazuiensis TaxID=2936508 RepID=UPI00200F177A|nr:flagellar biosynthetic protein FliO [Paenibacillus hamazuiensis]